MLIATDLDGTLLPNGASRPSARTAAVLADADRAQVPVVFVTGRPLRWLEPLRSLVGHHGRIIAANGAAVLDAASGEVVRTAGLEPAVGTQLVDRIAAALPGASFAIECHDGIRVDPRFGGPSDHRAGAPRGPLAALWDVTAFKLLVRHDGAVETGELHRRVAEVVGEDAVCTWSSPGLVEISAPGVTKASALAWLAEQLKVERRAVTAFGDMPNDVPMLRWAGHAVAVADAHEQVLAVADEVAPACEDDGVAEVITRLLRAR